MRGGFPEKEEGYFPGHRVDAGRPIGFARRKQLKTTAMGRNLASSPWKGIIFAEPGERESSL